MRPKRPGWADKPYRDTERILALRARAVQHLDQCREFLGPLRQRRKGAHSEGWDGPIREAMADEARPGVAQARAAWEQAERCWWEMAETARSIAVAEARRLEWVCQHVDGIALDDLEAIAFIACHRAAQTWDPAKGSGWGTYAGRSCKTWILKEVRTLRMSHGTREAQLVGIHLAMREMERRHGQAYLPWALDWLGIDREKGTRLYQAAKGAVRLDDRRSPDEDSGLVSDLLADDPVDPARARDQQVVAVLVHEAIDKLPSRWAKVVRGRMRGETLNRISQDLDLSRERIRQIELAAMAELRRLLAPKLGTDIELECLRQ